MREYKWFMATHFEEITHFKKIFKVRLIWTKSTHFEFFFQSALNLAPT